MSAILGDASGKMHHGMLFNRRLQLADPFFLRLHQPQPRNV